MAKILFSVMRNEAPFILEWVAHHHQLGFDKIVVYSNNSDDGTHELLDALDAAGSVVHDRHTPADGQSPQVHAVIHFQKSGLMRDGDHVMFLDADEFLNIKIGDRSLDALLDYIGPAQGMSINWRVFGDSHHRIFQDRLISHAYQMGQPDDMHRNKRCKTIFRVSADLEWVNLHKPRFSPAFWAKDIPFLSADGTPITQTSPYHHFWSDPTREEFVSIEAAGFDIAQVNHYQLRSITGLALKNMRGTGGTQSTGETLKYKPEKYHGLNQNRAPDSSILFYEDRITSEMRNLLADTAVRSCHQIAVDRYKTFEATFLSRLRKDHQLLSPTTNAPKPKPPRLIVHLGQMKTGTTTLQNHLTAVSGELKAHDVFYPASILDSDAHHEIAALVENPDAAHDFVDGLAGSRDAARVAANTLLSTTKTWIARNPQGTAILSTETIDLWTEDSMSILKDILMDLAGDDFNVVLYVRSPLAGAMSRLQQSLYNLVFFPSPIGMLNPDQLRVLSKVFQHRLKVRVFDRADLIDGDIVRDFMQTFLPHVPHLPDRRPAKALNVGLSAEAMFVLQDAKLTLSPNGAPINTPLTRRLNHYLHQIDPHVADFGSPKLRPDLIAPLTRLQTDALEARDLFDITFKDLDYDLIGTASRLDLAPLVYARNIASFDEKRLAQLRSLILSDNTVPADLRDLVRASQPKGASNPVAFKKILHFINKHLPRRL